MTSETPSTRPTAGCSRWWNILFGLSLAANLVVVGIVAGHRFAEGPPARSVFMQLLPHQFFWELPRDRRQELMQMMRANMGDMEKLRETMMTAGQRLAEALERQPYDPEQMKQALSDVVSSSQSVMARGSEGVSELIGKLTPEERLLLAKAIRERKLFRRP